MVVRQASKAATSPGVAIGHRSVSDAMIFAAVAGPSTAGEAVNFLAPMEIAAKTATPPSSHAFLVMHTSYRSA
jgi:hypothetical protein